MSHNKHKLAIYGRKQCQKKVEEDPEEGQVLARRTLNTCKPLRADREAKRQGGPTKDTIAQTERKPVEDQESTVN